MTTSLIPSAHAAIRMSQRGIGDNDIELMLYLASEVEGGFLVREKDFKQFERDLKRLSDHARRLIGKRFVVDGKCLVTAYHVTEVKKRRLLRDRREIGASD